MSKIFAALLLSAGIALSGYFVAYGVVESRKPVRSVQVKGLAERTVKSDEAIWTLNFKLVNEQLPELYQSLEQTQKKVRDFLEKEGFAATAINMSPVTVTDNQSVNYSQNQNMPRYSADAGLTISTAEVDKVTQSLQNTGALVEQGVVVTGSSVVYRFNGLNDIKPDMLNEATLNAYEAAQSFASNANAQLADIRRAVQGLFTISDANSSYDSGAAVLKKVRVVTSVEYGLH
ncbi:MAG: SIMPL domain-containing protein [Legionellaceae bacterium]|nr:SIMPL domain-containing protein [Legionellaceae bacterium]